MSLIQDDKLRFLPNHFILLAAKYSTKNHFVSLSVSLSEAVRFKFGTDPKFITLETVRHQPTQSVHMSRTSCMYHIYINMLYIFIIYKYINIIYIYIYIFQKVCSLWTVCPCYIVLYRFDPQL